MGNEVKEYYSLIKNIKNAEAYMSVSFDRKVIKVGSFDEIKKLKARKEKELASEFEKWKFSYTMRVSTIEEINEHCNISSECTIRAKVSENRGEKNYIYVPKAIAGNMLKKACAYSNVYHIEEYRDMVYDDSYVETQKKINSELYYMLEKCSYSEDNLKLIDLVDTEKMINSSRFGLVRLSEKNLKYRILDVSRSTRRARYNMDDAIFVYNAILKTLNEYEIKSGQGISLYSGCKFIEAVKENIIGYERTKGYDDIREILVKCFELTNKYGNSHSDIIFYNKFNRDMYISEIDRIFKNKREFYEFGEMLKGLVVPKNGEIYILWNWKSESGYNNILEKMKRKAIDLKYDNGHSVVTGTSKRIMVSKLMENFNKLYPSYIGYLPYSNFIENDYTVDNALDTILYKEV